MKISYLWKVIGNKIKYSFETLLYQFYTNDYLLSIKIVVFSLTIIVYKVLNFLYGQNIVLIF